MGAFADTAALGVGVEKMERKDERVAAARVLVGLFSLFPQPKAMVLRGGWRDALGAISSCSRPARADRLGMSPQRIPPRPATLGTIARSIVIATAITSIPARADDLLQVYQQARRADPVLSAADAQRGIAREGVVQARAPLLPQASAGVAFDRTQPGGDPGERNSSRSASVTLNQVLVDVARLSQLHVAQSQADAQDDLVRAAEQALCARVARAYFDVLTADDAVRQVEANEDAYRQQVEQSDQRYRNGLTAQVDVEQARAYHAAARAASIDARQARDEAREALSEITGQPAPALNRLQDELPMALPAPADPQAWVDEALLHNPTLSAQRHVLEASDQDIAAARAAHLPTLGANLGLGRAAAWPTPASNTDGRNVASVGIVLNVPLFAGGATQSRLRQALHQQDAARDDYELRRRRVARETLEQYRSIAAGIGRIGATRAAVESAGRALASTRIGQELGTQTMTDLLLAIQTQASAQASYSQARHQFVLSRLLLLQAAGRIDEADLAAVNTLLKQETP